MAETLIAVAGLALLFVFFGAFGIADGRKGCHDCAHQDGCAGSCELAESAEALFDQGDDR